MSDRGHMCGPEKTGFCPNHMCEHELHHMCAQTLGEAGARAILPAHCVANHEAQGESQWIVVQGPLSALTVPGCTKVVCKRFITPDTQNVSGPR